MVITDALGKPKVTTGHCDYCGGGRKLDETNCPHCAAPAPKPKTTTLKESLAQRKAYTAQWRLMPWPGGGGTESGGPR
jgi:predicted amidophosphoribosyltransferase